jgi:hypothetical protein
VERDGVEVRAVVPVVPKDIVSPFVFIRSGMETVRQVVQDPVGGKSTSTSVVWNPR